MIIFYDLFNFLSEPLPNKTIFPFPGDFTFLTIHHHFFSTIYFFINESSFQQLGLKTQFVFSLLALTVLCPVNSLITIVLTGSVSNFTIETLFSYLYPFL